MWSIILCFVIGIELAIAADAPKVKVDLYYESLCPYCRAFIAKQLWPTYEKVKDIMDITLIPFGNAYKKNKNGTLSFSCQHGPNECIGNVIEACAIEHIKNFDEYFPYITCMEKDIVFGPEKSARMCAVNTTLPLADILTCSKGREGLNLEDQAANRTNSLIPKKKYVPWVVLNGEHTQKISNRALSNLLGLVCSTYKGTKPAPCSAKHHVIG
ncbi:hypothetical protein LOTGIDRAFT_235669 [Lottia gigantea]|uniref:Saposin A-type domain-containing protein n=1 Tax=Lottia gigantea TaxID=225164 RepID=V3ZP42_LOTGI|nr:hypothetical protein LOTGIDRAFT_235669 [Lottia gigantea]ESO86102.1 hypothetical protein LOTGIDRAFT_235669 [Lottia gigantea]